MTGPAVPTLEQIQAFEGRYPRQLWPLFFSLLFQRFSFYGMTGVSTLFMIERLQSPGSTAFSQVGATQTLLYTTVFMGGLLADKILGFRRSLFWGSSLVVVGALIVAVDPEEFFFLGLAFNIVGTGFLRPNTLAMVGQLYKEGDARRDTGFSLVYAGTSLGALGGGAFCMYLGSSHSWNLCFVAVALAMTASVVTFGATRKDLGPIGLQPAGIQRTPWKEWAVYGSSLLLIPLIMTMISRTEFTDYLMYALAPLALGYLFHEMSKYGYPNRQRFLAVLVFLIITTLFWALLLATPTAFGLLAAGHLDLMVLGLGPIDADRAASDLFVITLAPLLGLVWLWMARRKIEPSTAVKFALGFLLMSGAAMLWYASRSIATPDGTSSLGVSLAALFLLAMGELCVAPMGLSLVTKLSPRGLQGTMIGAWFLPGVYSGYLGVLLREGIRLPDKDILAMGELTSITASFQQLAYYALIAGLTMLVIAPLLRRLMIGVR